MAPGTVKRAIPHVEESKQIVGQLGNKNWQDTIFKTQIYQGRGCQSPENKCVKRSDKLHEIGKYFALERTG